MSRRKAYNKSSVTGSSAVSSDIESGRSLTIINEQPNSSLQLTDDALIQHSINMAGQDAFGIIGVDLWILSKESGKLSHFGKAGLNWMCPIYKRQLEDEQKYQALDALEDLYHDSIVEDEIVGQGLAGNFYQIYGPTAGSSANLNHKLTWHDLREFTTNPFQMPSQRMMLLEKVFGKATGVPFNVLGRFKGLVVYYVRKSYDEVGVNSDANTAYMHFAAENIGSVAAMAETRLDAITRRKEKVDGAIRRFKLAMKTMDAFQNLAVEEPFNKNENFEDDGNDVDYKSSSNSILDKLMRRMTLAGVELKRKARAKAKQLKEKSLNPPLEAPPSTSWGIAATTTLSCFVAFLAILGMNQGIKHATDNDYSIILGPFGALITLQYALTAAPPSQPSNCLYGMVTCLAVPFVVKTLLYELAGMPQWVVACIGTSLAIGTMCKMGTVHPPAGATAIVFSMSNRGFTKDIALAGLMLAADVVAVILAIILNNSDDTKQYPMYPMWHLGKPPKGFNK
jgi:hypothetical protein